MSATLSPAQTASALLTAQRVLVIGCAGAGKTTLARRLSTRFDLPFQSLDRDARWLPEWVARDPEEQRAIITRLAGAERWVMDGSDPDSLDLRLPRADLVLWLRVPRATAVVRVLWRGLVHWGRVRPGMARGCPERLPSASNLSALWQYDRDQAPVIEHHLTRYGADVRVVQLQSPVEIAQLFAT